MKLQHLLACIKGRLSFLDFFDLLNRYLPFFGFGIELVFVFLDGLVGLNMLMP